MLEAFKRRMQAKGLEFPLPPGRLPVIMEDEIVHTVDFPVCNDSECICYSLEREQMIRETTPPKKRRRRSSAQSYEAPAPKGDDGRTFRLMR